MKNLKSFLFIVLMIFFVGCKQTKYVVRIQPSFFYELTKFGVEKTIFQNEKILIELSPEISLQKEKLEKTKIQRKAMQQYLLTGIVRVG